jgi:acyl-coenzyme A synthetase/AMP-(fatty) acid ligase
MLHIFASSGSMILFEESTRSVDAQKLLTYVCQYKPTVFFSFPIFYERMLTYHNCVIRVKLSFMMTRYLQKLGTGEMKNALQQVRYFMTGIFFLFYF